MSCYNVTHPEFEAKVDLDDYLKRCVKFIKPGLSNSELKSVMYQVYETEYGIYDHMQDNRDRPLASIAFFDIENTLDGSMMDSTSRMYVQKGMKDLFGLNILEFLSLTRDKIELFVEIANEEEKRKQPIVDGLNKEFKNLNKK